jgi:hypothetical protein
MTPKERYFEKTYANAPIIKCKCGCGGDLKSKDKYARDVEYINGHNGRKYNDPTQHKREWNHRNRSNRASYKELFQRKRKVELIKLKGGKCEKCPIEYNGKNACIFQFHHRDPATKKFGLNVNAMGKAWETILKELDKCCMLCSNCHSSEHSAEY